MTGGELALWIILALIGFAGSGLYSGMETGAYSLNRVRLHLLDHQGVRAARALRHLIDRPTVLLTTLLIGTNAANYLGTASLGTILEDWGLGPWQTIALNTLLVTPILFILSETLPKDLFAVHADKLMYRLTPVLTFSRRLFTVLGVVPLIGLFTSAVAGLVGGRKGVAPLHPRRRVEALMKEGVGYGLLSDEQSVIVERVLDLANRRVEDEMVPWRRVLTVRASDTPARLWELADRTSRSRFPVLDERGRVGGVVEITAALVHEPARCPPIRELMTPAFTLRSSQPLREALGQLQSRGIAFAVVLEARDRPVGVVTIKDLVEPITGELASW